MLFLRADRSMAVFFRLLSLSVVVLLSNLATICPLLPSFDKFRRCQQAQLWPLNGRPLVNDYRGRVLLLLFVPLERDGQCKRELNRLDTLSDHLADVRVLAVAPREEETRKVRALAWQFPRIRFEQETADEPVWRWFDAKPLDKAIFDRCSRLTVWVPSGADFSVTLSALQTTLSSSPCGQCDFDSGQKRIHWPSLHPPVPLQQKKSNVFMNIDGQFHGHSSSLRRWNSPSSAREFNRHGATKTAKRLHWTVDNGEQQRKVDEEVSSNKKQLQQHTQQQQQQMEVAGGTFRKAPSDVTSPQQKLSIYPERQRHQYQQQQQYLYGQQLGNMQQQQQQSRQRHGQHSPGEGTIAHADPGGQREMARMPTMPGRRHSNGDDERIGTRNLLGHQMPSMHPKQQQRKPVETTTAEPEPAPLYPEGSEDTAGFDYYGDEYAADWTTETPAAMQIPKPTKPATPTIPTTQTDKNFGFELPCTGFNDESCFQQQTQLRPNEVHRCCRGRILFTDQCAVGKCSNATVQLCCIQRFLQAKLTCCSDERQADTDVGDHFSRCCFEHFVDGEDTCCPRAYAAEQWRSVHELCLPNVDMDLTGVKVPSPLIGTTLITDFDFGKTDKWRFECRYGAHVQQYSFFEASASSEEDDKQRDEEDE